VIKISITEQKYQALTLFLEMQD